MNNYPFVKKRIALLAAFISMMGLFLVALTISISYTYSSKASDEPQKTVTAQEAIVPTEISSQLPVCVKFLQYMVNRQGTQCYLSIECDPELSQVPNECTQNESILQCTSLAGVCRTDEDILTEAKKICGC